MKRKELLWLAVLLIWVGSALAQNNPRQGDTTYAPDAWLLAAKGQPWWYETQGLPATAPLQRRAATKAEQVVIERAAALLSTRTAKAIALIDGDAVVYVDFKAPANSDSILFGFSMGKTVTSIAVGQAICDGKLRLDSKAGDVVSELRGKYLGSATVRDLLMMASGAAEGFSDSSIWTPEQFKRWQAGDLTILESVTEDRVSRAAKGVFSDYKPGESFSYKATDPETLGLMVTRATGMPYSRWVQKAVLDPMGAARTGLIVQDKAQDGHASGGVRLRLEDWIRFAQWIKRSSGQNGCFGDYVRAAMSTQIANSGTSATRKSGKLFGGYGYLVWTDNEIAPNTAWASGWGGQRIGWNKGNGRMVVAFSNTEAWMPELYELARDWGRVNQ